MKARYCGDECQGEDWGSGAGGRAGKGRRRRGRRIDVSGEVD
jgi:hypothetical protein